METQLWRVAHPFAFSAKRRDCGSGKQPPPKNFPQATVISNLIHSLSLVSKFFDIRILSGGETMFCRRGGCLPGWLAQVGHRSMRLPRSPYRE